MDVWRGEPAKSGGSLRATGVDMSWPGSFNLGGGHGVAGGDGVPFTLGATFLLSWRALLASSPSFSSSICMVSSASCPCPELEPKIREALRVRSDAELDPKIPESLSSPSDTASSSSHLWSWRPGPRPARVRGRRNLSSIFERTCLGRGKARRRRRRRRRRRQEEEEETGGVGGIGHITSPSQVLNNCCHVSSGKCR